MNKAERTLVDKECELLSCDIPAVLYSSPGCGSAAAAAGAGQLGAGQLGSQLAAGRGRGPRPAA